MFWLVITLEIIALASSLSYVVLKMKSDAYFALHLCVLVIAFVMVVLFTISFGLNHIRRAENLHLMRKIELFKEHYNPIIEKMAEIDKFRHDARNYLALLQNASGDIDAITELTNTLIDYSDSLAEIKYCDNKYLNIILSEKHKECMANDIKFDCAIVFSEDIGIDDKDICSCFMNLLENAIEANMTDDSDMSRWVNIRANVIGNYLIIKQTNSAWKTIKTNSRGQIVTTKVNVKDHGFGLKIIDNIAKKYNGYTEFFTDNGVFNSNVYLEIAE